jgi:hypothetical protein
LSPVSGVDSGSILVQKPDTSFFSPYIAWHGVIPTVSLNVTWRASLSAVAALSTTTRLRYIKPETSSAEKRESTRPGQTKHYMLDSFENGRVGILDPEDKKIIASNQVDEHGFPVRKRKTVDQHFSDNITDVLFQQIPMSYGIRTISCMSVVIVQRFFLHLGTTLTRRIIGICQDMSGYV